MERRVLIVESQNDFALSMATVLKSAGYQTAMAATAAEAQRELEKRRPDLIIVRAELPDQSGFTLCGQIKKGKWGQNLKVLLLSSDTGVEGLNQHRQTQGAADGYLLIPFEMGELASMSVGISPPGGEAPREGGSHEGALASPPPLRGTAPAGGPPRLPRRERRSAITEEDRTFLERSFQSIADRKAELLAESRQLRRPPPRRDLMGTPEGKVQLLRDELKVREAQIARISEIWNVRERELLSVEDRLHEKDVELQGLKMQVDDMLRRFNEAQQSMLQKEREHGATVDGLLLQKFSAEKELIEVVASKEKDINVLRREVSGRDDELARRAQDLENARNEYENLEKHLGIVTLEFEVKEQKLTETVRAHETELQRLTDERAALEARLTEQIAGLEADLARTIGERDQLNLDKDALESDLPQRLQERDAKVASLEHELREAIARDGQHEAELRTARAELSRITGFLQETEALKTVMEEELSEQLSQVRNELAETQGSLAATRDALAQEQAAHARSQQQAATRPRAPSPANPAPPTAKPANTVAPRPASSPPPPPIFEENEEP